MLRILSNVLLLLWSVSALAGDSCIQGTIKKVSFGKVLKESLNFCFNEKLTEFFSPSCLNRKCSALKLEKKFHFSELHSQVGSPLFKLCRELNGRPEIVEYEVKGKFYKLDRCNFSDGDFVNCGLLWSIYVSR